jgi:hypothetical protein
VLLSPKNMHPILRQPWIASLLVLTMFNTAFGLFQQGCAGCFSGLCCKTQSSSSGGCCGNNIRGGKSCCQKSSTGNSELPQQLLSKDGNNGCCCLHLNSAQEQSNCDANCSSSNCTCVQEQQLPLVPDEQSQRTSDWLKLGQYGDISPPALLQVPEIESFPATSLVTRPAMPSGIALRILLCSWTT